MKRHTAMVAIVVLGLTLATQGWGQSRWWDWDPGERRWQAQMGERGGMGRGGMGSMQRHRQVMRQGVPEPYASLRPPAASAEQVARGADLYRTHCAACHGTDGRGNGPTAASLDPAPANLKWLTSMPMGRDTGYLAFAIAEGGVAYGTAMPAYKDVLEVDERQAVVAFLLEGL